MFTTARSSTADRTCRTPLSAISLHTLFLLLALLLSGCNRGKVEELQAENTKLKGELEKNQEQFKELAAKEKQEVAAREQQEAEKTNLKGELEKIQEQFKELAAKQKQEAAIREQEAAARQQEEAKRKLELAEQAEKARREQEAKKAQAIDKCFDRIELQMKALMNEPRDFAFKTRAERETIESRLKTVANSKQTEIGEIIIELKGLEFPATRDLEFAIRSFVRNYTSMIFHERLTYNYIDMGSDEYKRLQEDSKKYMGLAYDDMTKVSEIKRKARTKETSVAEKP